MIYILERLRKLRKISRQKWQACCPSHDDNTPSLSIKLSDNCLLLYCHAGCTIHDICGALSIKITDLFLNRKDINTVNDWKKARFQEALINERLIVAMYKNRCTTHQRISKQDDLRYQKAVERIQKIEEIINVVPHST